MFCGLKGGVRFHRQKRALEGHAWYRCSLGTHGPDHRPAHCNVRQSAHSRPPLQTIHRQYCKIYLMICLMTSTTQKLRCPKMIIYVTLKTRDKCSVNQNHCLKMTISVKTVNRASGYWRTTSQWTWHWTENVSASSETQEISCPKYLFRSPKSPSSF